MKNIILQHWNGNLRELEKLSVESMQKYAKYVGAGPKSRKRNRTRKQIMSTDFEILLEAPVHSRR